MRPSFITGVCLAEVLVPTKRCLIKTRSLIYVAVRKTIDLYWVLLFKRTYTLEDTFKDKFKERTQMFG